MPSNSPPSAYDRQGVSRNDYGTLAPYEIERLSRRILPGEWAVEAQRPLSTLLGSCIAVCLFDTALPIAGMNHFMLPQMRTAPYADEDLLLAGGACMEALLNAMLAQGAARHRIKAKVFGGGMVIDPSRASEPALGKRNADFARDWLSREGIPLIASDFLGPWSRKVLVVPATGDAYCKRMASSMLSIETLRREEEQYARSLLGERSVQGGKRVEIF